MMQLIFIFPIWPVVVNSSLNRHWSFTFISIEPEIPSMDHSPFLGMESSFYRRSKINKYTRRLLKTRRGRLDFTLWPYEDYSITQDDSPRMTRWGTITWRELLHETRWLDEDDSTRVTRRGDDSKRTTRRGSHDEARWFDETTLSHKGGTSVLRIVLTSLFIFFNH